MTKGTIIFFIQTILLLASCANGVRNDKEEYDPEARYIQIVLFHLARRCESCNAVEDETKAFLEERYSEELASGKIRFVSLDYQSDNGKDAARQLKASGQSLFIVKGDTVSDLTSPAFMFSVTHPERYRDALTRELDTYIE